MRTDRDGGGRIQRFKINANSPVHPNLYNIFRRKDKDELQNGLSETPPEPRPPLAVVKDRGAGSKNLDYFLNLWRSDFSLERARRADNCDLFHFFLSTSCLPPEISAPL